MDPELKKLLEEQAKAINSVGGSSSKELNAVKDELKKTAGETKTAVDSAVKEINGVKDALRAQLGGLAVIGAEKILGASIDQNAHAELVSQLAAEI